MSLTAEFHVYGATQAALHAEAVKTLAQLDPGDGWSYTLYADPFIAFGGGISSWRASVRARYNGEPTPAPPAPDPALDSYDTHGGTAEETADPRLFSHDDRDYVPPPPANHGRRVGGWGRRKRT